MKLPYYRAIFLHLSVVFTLLFGFTINAQIIQIGQDIDGEAAFDYSGHSVSINAAGDRVAIGAHGNDGSVPGGGHVRIYAWNGISWTQQGQDIDGEAASDDSGYSVSLNAAGDRVAIGAPYNGGNGSYAGHVRIYTWNGTSWTQQGQDIDGETAYDYSGRSVSINAAGDRVAIGAQYNNGNGSNAGHVRIYTWNGTSWMQQGQDIDGEAFGDESGNSVSMNAAGDRVAIGAPGNDGNGSYAGHVRIYAWNGTSWTQLGQDIDGEVAGDESGRSVCMNAAGDLVAIGANGNDGNGPNAGHVRIYAWNGTSWTQQGQDIDGEAADDRSGYSVSLNAVGDRVAIGAYNNDGNGSDAGHVRIYARNGTSWTQEGQDIDGEAGADNSGTSVSMNAAGDRVAIGAPDNDGNGSNAGHVRVYYDPNAVVNVGFEANTDIICLQDTVYFTDTSITNAITWQWRFGDGQSSTQANPYHIYSQEGNYDVTLIISDSAGTLDSATYYNYVHVIGPNSVSASSQDSVCLSGGSVHLDVSALTTNNIPYQLSWNTGDTSTQITNLNQGNYSYAMSVNQCVLQDTFTIGTGPNNIIDLQMYSDNVSCFGFDGSAGVSLINGNSFSFQDNFDSGNYNTNLWSSVVGGSVSNGCGSQSGNYALYFNGTSSRIATTVPLALQGTNSISFYLIIGTGSSPCEDADGGEDVVLEYSTNGSTWTNISTYYTYSYYNFTYINVNLPAAAQTNGTQLRWRQPYFSSSVDNWSIDDINITGNNNNDFTFQWNDPQQQTTSNLTGLSAGTYQVIVTDSLGCSGLDTVTVGPFTPIGVTVTTQDITCEGLTNGIATAVVTGGDAPYTYQFSGGFSSDSIVTSLSSGAYYVNITDQDNCTGMSNFYIYDANVPTISLTGTDPSCASGNDGTISSVITNGNAPFTYLWNDTLMQTTANASNLVNGTYTLTITDSLNCVYDSSVTISNQFIINTNHYPPTCYGFSDGSIAIDVQNGNNPTISWSNGATTDSISGLSGGSYVFSLSDNVLCTYIDTIDLIDPDSLIVSAQITDVSCNYNNGAITVNTNGASNSSNVLKMENNGYWSFTNISQYMSSFFPDEISFDLMSPDVTLNSSYFHSSFLVEDGTSDLVWFMMSVDENTSQPIMGPVVYSSVSGSVPSYSSYNIVPFYYNPGDWYHIEFRNIDYSNDTYDYYVNNQLIHTGVPFRDSPYDVDRFRISHYTPETVVSYFDNIDFSTNGTTIWGEDFENGLPNWSYNTNYSNNIVNANVISSNSVSYQWSNGDTTQTISNLSPGTYTVNVNSSSNCFSSANYTVTDLGSPTISLSSTNTTCLGASDGSVNIGVTGGASPYTYSYSQGNTLVGNIISEGAENGMGNFTSSGDVNFVTNTAFSHSGSSSYYNAYTNYNNNFLTCDTTFDFTNSTEAYLNFWHIAKTRGNDDYCYIEYSNNGGSTWNKIPTANYNGSASTYTGSYPYFDEYSYSIWGSSSSPNNTWWQEENFDLGFLTGQANVKIRFYLYSDNLYTKYGWLIDDITVSANNLTDSVVYNISSGIFPVTVTDANNCSVMDSVLVGANPYNMNLSFTTTNASCSGANNGSVQVSVNGGNGPYDYSFSQGNSSSNDLVNEDAENGLGGFVTSGNNLFYTTTNLSHSGNQSFFNDYDNYDYNSLAYDSDIDLSNATNISLNFWQIAKTEGGMDRCYVQYSNDGGVNWYNIPSGSYSGNATNYTGAYPNFDEDSYSIWGTSNTTPNNTWWQEENFDLSFLAGENDVRIRFYLYSNSSYYRYGWLVDDITLSVNNSQDSVAYNLSDGMVSVLVTDSTGCGVIDSVSIGVDSLFTASYQTTNITCFGENDGTINVTPNGGTSPFTYTWSSGSGSIVNHTEDFESGSTNSLYWPNYTGFIGDLCGVYSGTNAMYFDGSGTRYISSAPTNLSPNSSISFYLLYGSNSNSCETVDPGDEVSLEYSLNGSTWYNINTYSLSTYQNGVYEYISESIPSAAQGNNVSIRIIQNNHAGSGYDNWSLDDLTINFGGGGTSSSNAIDSLAAGNYTVTIVDSAGCTISNTVSVVEPPQLYTNSFSNSNGNLCYGQSNGTANVTASGGVPPYSFSWSNGQNGNNISNLGAGTYTCVVTDSFNCAKNESVQITAPYLLNANINSYDISCFGGNNGALTVNISGGTSPYNVSWSNGQNGTVINNLSAGHYSAMITDFNSCNTQILDSITEPTEILIVINTVDATTGMNNGSAVALVSGGTPPYTYVWSNGGYNSSIFNLGAGVYNITVTDNNQCQKSNSAVINSVTDIADNLVLNDVTISPNPFDNQAVLNLHNYNGTYDLSLYNSIGKLTRSYKSVSGKFILYKNNLAPGVYLLTIDANGKSIEKKIVVD